MKKILFLLFAFISLNSYAQLDREHWFAPMVDRTGNGSNVQRIYMSTNEVSPFKVDVYSNNVVVGSVTISKNNPQYYDISQRSLIIVEGYSNNDLFRPINKGIYLKGAKAFFASLRFSVSQHAEILTSKGTAAIGTEFRAVMAPITANNDILNFMTSVMATEDNTNVTISNFSPTLQFSDGIARTQITFKLNKGQSYIVDGTGDFFQNYTGFIGAKIVADKGVSITNGNFNGQYATTATNSSDILMDQGVPVDRLGQEFILMKGNGTTTSGMERAIVVATEDNTEIFVNDSPTPVAVRNAGQFYLTELNAYKFQRDDHYNMRIATSKNVYVYQLLAGDNGSSMVATGGFNYIPPLSCYLPKKIDEIGFIDENRVYIVNQGSYRNNIPTKLNIITERGAMIDVKRNGISLPINSTNGPFDVSGNSAWVTYNIKGVTGNIAVFSSSAVTAGISAGDDAVGYGGYFAGFSFIPAIIKSDGECLPGVKLEVTEGFDTYEWLTKVGNVYVPAPGINNIYTYEPTQAGIYSVRVKQGSCPEIQTKDYKFFNCTTFTNYNYNTCTTQIVAPLFALSSQTVSNATIKIDVQPTKGTVVINPDGTITYTANPNATGSDTFKFSFCGTGAIPDCETVQATVNLNQVVTSNVILKECSTTNSAVFNLKNAAITPDQNAQKKYYRDVAFSDPIPLNLLANYPGTNGELIYIYLKNDFGCENKAIITLETDAPTIVTENIYQKNHCDEEIDGVIDGKYKVAVNSITPSVIPSLTGLTIRYYENEAKAIIGANDNIMGIYTFTATTNQIWIRIDNSNVCPPIYRKIILNIGPKFTINSVVADFICDNDRNGEAIVHLSTYTYLFTTETGLSVNYYDDLTKAQNGIIGENISNDTTITGDKVFYYRFKKQGLCEIIGTLDLTLRKPNTSPDLKNKEICPNSKTSLDAGAEFDDYLWSTGEKTQIINNVPIGEYFVDLFSKGCVYRQNVSVKAFSLPKIDRTDIKGSTVTVLVSGENPPYHYALDSQNYQSSNIFTNVSGGDHTIYVISADNCEPVSALVSVIELYNAITPNGDGINDVLNYSTLLKKEDAFLQIYDRYGKLVFAGDKNNRFSWDGKAYGKLVGTGTFWYVMKYKEPGSSAITEYSGWVLVKNRE